MKTRNLLLAAALICSSFSLLNSQTILVDEDFSSAEWEAELARLNPGNDEFGVPKNPNATNPVAYTTPANTGGGVAYQNLNAVDLYFGKYRVVGGIEVLPTGLCEDGVTHAHPTTGDAVGFRFTNPNPTATPPVPEGIFELPEITSAGTIKVHVKNGNNTNDCNLGLEKYNAATQAWDTIKVFTLRKRNNLKNDLGEVLLDETLEFDINSNAPIKLRLRNFKYGTLATRFQNMYRITVTEYKESAVINPEAAGFKQAGRKLIVDEPTKISIYNTIGSLMFEKQVVSELEIPASLGNGVFMVKTSKGSQKISLN